MAHKQCIEGMRLNHLCDCIKDDIMLLEVIEDNIDNLEKIVYNYFEIYKHNPSISTFAHYLQLKLKVINE